MSCRVASIISLLRSTATRRSKFHVKNIYNIKAPLTTTATIHSDGDTKSESNCGQSIKISNGSSDADLEQDEEEEMFADGPSGIEWGENVNFC